MNLSLPTVGSGLATLLVVAVALVVLVLLALWGWKMYRRKKASGGKRYQPNAKSFNADQFIFEDDNNELQSKLEAKLSRAQEIEEAEQTATKQSSPLHKKSTAQPARQTKKRIGHADKSVDYAQIEKVDLARLVAAIESLKQAEDAASLTLDPADDSETTTTLIEAAEIERLSFHLESSNREIASLAAALASQTQRVTQLEKDAPDVWRRNMHQKITLLANSIIQRNATIKTLGSDYKKQVALVARAADASSKKSQLLQQCKIIKLQIKLQGQSLIKERELMSKYTRLHRAMQAPPAARTSSLLQLADQTNEIKSQNANLKSLVDNLSAEFGQLRSIVDGLKSEVGKKASSGKFPTSEDQSSVKDKRPAANDASIAAAQASASNNSHKPTEDPGTFKL